jgi:16S rRNA (cytosine967-C5)-methyltransferase
VTTPARRLAATVLADIEHGPTVGERLAAPEVEALDPRERSFLHELVLGVLRRRGGLDYALASLVDRPLASLSPDVLTALRLGAYQLLHLRVPEHAALSESVELVRAARPRAAGFVNAVLRRLQREGPPREPDPATEPLRWLTTIGSLPPWIAQRWLERLGPVGAVARARVLLEEPPTFFRFNPRRETTPETLAAAGIEARPTDVPEAWELLSGRLVEAARQGHVYVQDRSSQLVARLAAASGGSVLDACAAPGGKSLLLADTLGPSARVIAAEASPRRLRTLAALARLWGATGILPVGADARRPPFRSTFDTVLLDAPCSGLGTIARHPDIRWRLRPRDLGRQAHRQLEIVNALAPLVKPGGRLVYATCSIEDEENEGVVGRFLEAHPDFRPDPLPDWARPFASGAYLETRPEAHRGDGFFAAVLRRVAS